VGSPQALGLEDVYETIREDIRWDHLRQPGIVLVKGRGQDVPGLCRAMIVGEAPGATENTRRRPFCGPSGRVLDQLMAVAGLYPDEYDCSDEAIIATCAANCFITNVVKYRPPGNRTPRPDEIAWGAEALRKEWTMLGRPRLLVAVGATARAALVPKMFGTVAPGKVVDLGSQVGEGPFVWVHYHPGWGLRQGDSARRTMERQWEEMGAWMTRMLYT